MGQEKGQRQWIEADRIEAVVQQGHRGQSIVGVAIEPCQVSGAVMITVREPCCRVPAIE
ncbi:MAG: hypothetical protein WBF93_11800 [Pirellulales bacterium]|nr:hypothetical protein [Pirellulales bacterium]